MADSDWEETEEGRRPGADAGDDADVPGDPLLGETDAVGTAVGGRDVGPGVGSGDIGPAGQGVSSAGEATDSVAPPGAAADVEEAGIVRGGPIGGDIGGGTSEAGLAGGEGDLGGGGDLAGDFGGLDPEGDESRPA